MPQKPKPGTRLTGSDFSAPKTGTRLSPSEFGGDAPKPGTKLSASDLQQEEPGIIDTIVGGFTDLFRRTGSNISTLMNLAAEGNRQQKEQLANPLKPATEITNQNPVTPFTQQQVKDLKSGSLDLAGMLAGGGVGAGVARTGIATGTRLLPKLIRTIGPSIATQPAFTDPETADDPTERLKETGAGLAFDLGLTGTASKIGAPLAKKTQEFISKKADDLSPTFEKLKKKAADFVFGGEGSDLKSLASKQLKTHEELVKKRPVLDVIQENFPEATKNVDDVLERTADVVQRETDEIFEQGLNPRARLHVDQVENVKRTGTIQPKGKRSELVKTPDSPSLGNVRKTAVSADIIRQTKREFVTAGAQLKAITKKFAREGSAQSADALRDALKRFEQVEQAFTSAKASAGTALREYQIAVRELRDSTVEHVPGKFSNAISRWEMVQRAGRSGNTAELAKQSGRLVADFMRSNVFPLLSKARDAYTNSSRLAGRIGEGLVLDITDVIRKGDTGFDRTAAVANRLIRPKQSIFSPPNKVSERLDFTALGTKFSPIFTSRELSIPFTKGSKVALEDLLFAPRTMKGMVDTGFKRFSAMVELEILARQQAKKNGLTGGAAYEFIERFLVEPPQEALEAAIRVGQEVGFNAPLSETAEKFSRSAAVQMFVTPFPRWGFQFTKWAVTMTPLDPTFWKKVRANKATADDFTAFVTRNMQGIGAVAWADTVLFDDTDFDSMDYITPKGPMRLTGLTPLPDLLSIAALLFRGDFDKAMKAGSASSILPLSIPASGFVGRGLLSDLMEAWKRTGWAGKFWQKEAGNVLANLLPSKGTMEAIESLTDDIRRKGGLVNTPLSKIPGLSKLVPPVIDPTTGEPQRSREFIPGTDTSIPRIGIPFAPQERTPLAIEMARLGNKNAVKRPRRATQIKRIVPEELADEAVTKFEELAGKEFARTGNAARESRRFIESLTDEQRDKLLERLFRKAGTKAKKQVRREFSK